MTPKRLLFTAICIVCFFGVNAQQPAQSITGTILNKESGVGIPNVTINVFGTNKSTRTDKLGRFSLPGIKKDGQLLIMKSFPLE